ncbi:hypothetical protein R1flu_027439 [Riccia fluitans]|uniref:Uncharacterized protein n=1 Tax=Riccia fluitans TaxID=41844 RepID=A0ABD1XLQ8_9MARC
MEKEKAVSQSEDELVEENGAPEQPLVKDFEEQLAIHPWEVEEVAQIIMDLKDIQIDLLKEELGKVHLALPPPSCKREALPSSTGRGSLLAREVSTVTSDLYSLVEVCVTRMEQLEQQKLHLPSDADEPSPRQEAVELALVHACEQLQLTINAAHESLSSDLAEVVGLLKEFANISRENEEKSDEESLLLDD